MGIFDGHIRLLEECIEQCRDLEAERDRLAKQVQELEEKLAYIPSPGDNGFAHRANKRVKGTAMNTKKTAKPPTNEEVEWAIANLGQVSRRVPNIIRRLQADRNRLQQESANIQRYMGQENAKLQRFRETVEAIEALANEEASSVTVHYPNPELDGPAFDIDVTRNWLGSWLGAKSSRRFSGNNLFDCLQKALAAKQQQVERQQSRNNLLDCLRLPSKGPNG